MAILKAYYKNTSVIESRSKVMFISFGMFVKAFTQGIWMRRVTTKASDFFQDWWAKVTYGAKYGGSFSEMMGPSISN